MAHLIINRGIAGSGKSTWTCEYINEDPENRVAVSRDSYRQMLAASPGQAPHGRHEDLITVMQQQAVEMFLKDGKTVIVDDTNLPAKRVRSWIRLAVDLGADWEVKDFTHVPLDVCLANNLKRARVVPEDVVRDMHKKFVKGSKVKDWTPAPKRQSAQGETYVPPKVADGEIILVDIDGTVADHEGVRSPFDYSKVLLDRPKRPVIEYVRRMSQNGDIGIVFMSGREDACREDTERWLKEHVGVDYLELHMRKTGDGRPDDIVKLEMFDEHIRDTYIVHSVVDDRDRVIKMWRGIGLTALQVSEGDF